MNLVRPRACIRWIAAGLYFIIIRQADALFCGRPFKHGGTTLGTADNSLLRATSVQWRASRQQSP